MAMQLPSYREFIDLLLEHVDELPAILEDFKALMAAFQKLISRFSRPKLVGAAGPGETIADTFAVVGDAVVPAQVLEEEGRLMAACPALRGETATGEKLVGGPVAGGMQTIRMIWMLASQYPELFDAIKKILAAFAQAKN